MRRDRLAEKGAVGYGLHCHFVVRFEHAKKPRQSPALLQRPGLDAFLLPGLQNADGEADGMQVYANVTSHTFLAEKSIDWGRCFRRMAPNSYTRSPPCGGPQGDHSVAGA